MSTLEEGLLDQNKKLRAENKELKEKLEPFEHGESYWYEQFRKVEADNQHLLNILHGNRQ